MDYLSIFLEDFNDPRETVFLLKIVHLKSAAGARNPDMLWAKYKNFQGLAFIPNTEKWLLWASKWKGKEYKSMFGVLRM